ncbi:hypothetical protein R0J90_13220, partial [Micrococcus sp. SIMBA_144]
LYFLEEGNYKELENLTADEHYDTRDFYYDLIEEITYEDNYFKIIDSPIDVANEEQSLIDCSEIAKKDRLKEIFVSLYIHDEEDPIFSEWRYEIVEYIDKDKDITKFVNKLLVKYNC